MHVTLLPPDCNAGLEGGDDVWVVLELPHPTNPPNLVKFNPLRCTVDPVPDMMTLVVIVEFEFMAVDMVAGADVVVVDPPRGPRLLDIPPPLDNTPPPPPATEGRTPAVAGVAVVPVPL